MNRLSLMANRWYNQKIQEEIKKQVKKKMDQDGGMPKGKFQSVVKVVIDSRGMVKYHIVTASGNSKIDAALQATLGEIRISEPPPAGMPAGDDAEDNFAGVEKAGPRF